MFKKKIINITLALSLFLTVDVLAFNSYKVDDYNRGDFQDWKQYKVDHGIETQPRQSWFSNFAQGVSNLFSDVKNFAVNTFTAIKDFTVNVYDSIKNFFVKTPDTDTGSLDPGIQSKSLDVTADVSSIDSQSMQLNDNVDAVVEKTDSMLDKEQSVALDTKETVTQENTKVVEENIVKPVDVQDSVRSDDVTPKDEVADMTVKGVEVQDSTNLITQQQDIQNRMQQAQKQEMTLFQQIKQWATILTVSHEQYNPIKVTVDNSLDLVNDTKTRYANNIAMGDNKFIAGATAFNLSLGDVVGYTPLLEGVIGVDSVDVRLLSGNERFVRINVGALQTGLAVVGGAEALHATKTSLVGLVDDFARYSGDDFVHVAPKSVDGMISKTGLKQEFSTYVTKIDDIRGLEATDFNRVLYNKKLQPLRKGKFDEGAVVFRIKPEAGKPNYKGLTNMQDKVRQWKYDKDIAAEYLEKIAEIK